MRLVQRCLTFFVACLLLHETAVQLAAAEFQEVEKRYLAGDYAGCLTAVEQSTADGQTGEEWLLLKTRALLVLGRYPQAMQQIELGLAAFRASLAGRFLGYEVYRANGQPGKAYELLQQIQAITVQTPWRYSDPANRLIVGRVALLLGNDPRQVLEVCFDRAKKDNPNLRDAYLAIGRLALDKHDYKVAAEAFLAGLKMHPKDADLHFGLFQAYEPSDPQKAAIELREALAANPNHLPALLHRVDDAIDAENYVAGQRLLEQIWLINPWLPEAWAYRAVIAHLQNEHRCEQVYRDVALHYWPTNPAVDHLMGKKLSQKYRFAEGADHQRQALQFDADFLPARIQLSQDLLRLGHEEEGWKLADEVHRTDGYDTAAYNLVTLKENLQHFRTLENDAFVVRMEAREADIYGARVLELLQRAHQTLTEKYELKPAGRVIVEIFPQQNDFAVRTFGMPGGAGFLGVCFGRVITANSPASQGNRPSNWEAVLWHEFCHVITLEVTRNKMPRWLSEGISVYEERQANPAWGQTMNPQYRQMVLGGELTPVGQLSGAFLSPPTPLHLQFAYYQSSLVVEYLIGRHGFVTLKRILRDLGAGLGINEALARHTGSLAQLEQEFAEFARQRAHELAPQAEWEKPDFANADQPSAALLEFLKEHPNNVWALSARAKQLIADQQWLEAKPLLKHWVSLDAGFTGSDDPLRLLAAVHRKLDETDDETSALERLSQREADAADACLRLIELATAKGDWPAARRAADRLLAVNPLLPQGHRALACASEETGDLQQAAAAYRTLLHFEPPDPADIHFRLARALHGLHDPRAKRHVLQALEEAPRFRAAQQLLLEIVRSEKP